MPDSLLTVLKFVLLALVWLFFFRVLRAVWAEMSGKRTLLPAAPPPPPSSPAPAAPNPAAAGPPPGRVSRRRAPGEVRLEIVEPAERKGRSFAVNGELTIGRAGGCGVSIQDDTYVSQLHARLFQRDGRVYVEDLGSTNGTFLNAKPVTGPVALSRGDRIQVGRTVLQVIP